MNLLNNPELLDRLCTHYALGTLRGGARRRFEALAREHAGVRSAALLWQSRMLSMNELVTPVTPDPAVWSRIDKLLQDERQAQTMMHARKQPAQANMGKLVRTWLDSLFLWRGAAAAGVFAAVLAVVNGIGLQAQLLATPQIEYVAVLADAKLGAAMLVTFDGRRSSLNLQRVGGYQEPSDRSLQLWALPSSGSPRSLGVLGSDTLLRLTAAVSDVQEAPILAISLEPQGGVPSAGGPTGPVLFTGALIRKMI